MNKKLTFSLLVFIIFYSSFGKNNCQNLVHKYNSEKSDTTKIRLALEIGNCYYQISEPDSAKKYYNITLYYINETKSKYKNKNSFLLEYESNTYKKIGDLDYDIGLFDEALIFYRKALNIAESNKILKEQSACYNNIAIVFHKKGMLDSAVVYYFNALKIDEKIKDEKSIAMRYNNLGNVYFAQKSYDKSLEYYQKSLKIKEKLKDTSGISFSYLNIGAIFYSQKKYNEALDYFNKSLELKKILKDYNGIILLYNNIGLIYRKQDKFNEAFHYYNLSLQLSKELNDKYKMAMIYENIAAMNYYYALKLENKQKANYLKKAIENSENSLKLSKELNSIEFINSSASTLFHAYFALGNFNKGLEYLKLYESTNDSLFNKTKAKAIAEAEKKFESEKKQLLIDNLTKERELQNLELKRQKTIIWSIVIGLIMAVIFAILMVHRFHITRKQKRIIEKQKSIVDEKNMLLNKQNEEIKAQHEIVVKQKEHIEEINKKITDSINYAKRIQDAVLPDKDTLNIHLEEHFIIYFPKDIVSGDFYWTIKINDYLIIVVADCTGHGVPGAFMSMLGISFLNEIVRKKEITKASQVLDELRKEIILALQQHCIQAEQKDGMDISFFVINTKTYECQWAGANNSLIILKNTNSGEKPWEIVEIKPDKMPIAIYPVMKTFTNHEFKLNKGDRIYLFSDGFYDQFGYENGKKLLYKRFKEIILQTANVQIKEQKKLLIDIFEKWKGLSEQTDDVIVLGVQV